MAHHHRKKQLARALGILDHLEPDGLRARLQRLESAVTGLGVLLESVLLTCTPGATNAGAAAGDRQGAAAGPETPIGFQRAIQASDELLGYNCPPATANLH